jgi:hypothetical protein
MGLGSGIRDPEKKTIPDPGVKKAPDPGSETLFKMKYCIPNGLGYGHGTVVRGGRVTPPPPRCLKVTGFPPPQIS